MSDRTLPPGVIGLHALPSDHHDGPWDSMIVPPGTKERLLGAALLVLRQGRLLNGLSGAPHGLIMLAGPPGTGKTTLAQGLAQAAALKVAERGATTLVEVDPHAFPSDMLGESQRAVSRLFLDTLPELAARRPHTVVLIDEVEALAVRRSSASFETNPVDVHRATDAVLSGLDQLRAQCPNLVLVATTNFIDAVDEAVLSRADLVMSTTLPGDEVIEQIVASSLDELAEQWTELKPLARDANLRAELAKGLRGLDGRRVRKTILAALTMRTEVALDPNRLTADDLRRATQFEA
ncbi:AAA family ATPase [Amycolatopsis sp. FDAARGOS 1241]|uniref:AAA family ATPase n=1 Tax=Amycolatopsis sp. FDAARGOS 1241 TaxID=2778070 RepID=UPI001950B941|nr:AAA family ATPase [Amycolatopsis sp. FDAARGOS 1241]QRP50463.1 AAA family ATPase [Amycolatopsis sp. FDAARGOS 1241]